MAIVGKDSIPKVKVYLAARYARRAEMEIMAKILGEYGIEIVSSWVYGGEEFAGSRERAALLDISDVDRADEIVSFTHPRGTPTPGGGRHVEFGYGLAKGKKLTLVGERENVFHHHPSVTVYANIDEYIATLV